jgi:hypothetical protein
MSPKEGLQFFDLKTMRPPEEGGSPLEIFLADPGVGGFGLFGLSEVSEDHQVKKWRELFLDGLIVPFHPQDLLCFWEYQIPQIINRQNESFFGRIVNSLCSVAHIGRVKIGKFLPIEGVEGCSLVGFFLHLFQLPNKNKPDAKIGGDLQMVELNGIEPSAS